MSGLKGPGFGLVGTSEKVGPHVMRGAVIRSGPQERMKGDRNGGVRSAQRETDFIKICRRDSGVVARSGFASEAGRATAAPSARPNPETSGRRRPCHPDEGSFVHAGSAAWIPTIGLTRTIPKNKQTRE